MHLLFSKVAQLCSTINVFTSILLGLLYSLRSMVLGYWHIHKLLDLSLSVITEDRLYIQNNVMCTAEVGLIAM